MQKQTERGIAIMSTIKVTTEIKREIDLYRQFMREHEYTIQTTLGYCTYLSRFLRRPTQGQTDSPLQRIRTFLEDQRKCNPENYKECRAALHLYFKMTTGESFPKHPPRECAPEIGAVLQRFYDYSVNTKRIKPNSAKREISTGRNFLEHIASDTPYHLKDITAHDIREFVINRLSHLTDSSKGREVTAIRNFFRFLKFEGVPVHESIFLLPLSPAVWKNAAFPTTMDTSVFDKLYEVPDKSTPAGKRDRCIILCFTELGLRCIEVAALSVDDFDWREGHVSIKNTKNHGDRKLPVSTKLMEALIEYLSNARPRTIHRTLFVRFKHICGEPMGCGQIRGVVRRVYEKSGADVPSTGTHILRRTAGSKIYNAGNSLKLTADILGHESLDSTVFYVKADITGLRQVAAPWPGTVGKAGVHDVK
jgi:site-specific recombinase XerD